jgi:hypothetical protein
VLTFLSNARFGPRGDPVTRDKWIQDAQAPSILSWRIVGKFRLKETFIDYAVIIPVFINQPAMLEKLLEAG